MKPLIKFGQSGEFGFDLNNAGQLVVMFNRGGTYEISPLTDDAVREIQLHGGVAALIETLHKLKRADKPIEREDVTGKDEPPAQAKEEEKPVEAKKRGRKKKFK